MSTSARKPGPNAGLDPETAAGLRKELVRWLAHRAGNADLRTTARPEGHGDVSVSALLDALEPPVQPDRAEAAHDQQITHEYLLATTRQVPPGPRRVLLLHDFGDMPLEQVATPLGCSTATARVRLHRARRRLREICRADCACEPATDGTPVCAPKSPKRSSKVRDAKPARAWRT